jgi:dihydrofolate reductase
MPDALTERHRQTATPGRRCARLFISLDGVVETPEKWQFPFFNEEIAKAVQKQMDEADTLLLGRVTYESSPPYGPPGQRGAVRRPDQRGTQARRVQQLQSVDWQNSTLINDDAAEQLRNLKAKTGNISISDSPTLVKILLQSGVFDELRLLAHPIVLDHGKRLFDDESERVPSRSSTPTFASGVQYLAYQPA